jgi:outer membrane protein assembly factor BamA
VRRILAWVALAACGGAPARVHKPGDEYLAAIRLEGNHAIASDDLIPRLGIHTAEEGQRAVDDYQLQLDTERITTAYQKLGFFAVQVHTRIEHHGDAATVVFAITEGARATTHVELVGLPDDVPAAKARALVQLTEGGPFDYDTFEEAKAELVQLLEDAGYARVALDARVVADRTHAQATAEYVFDAGPRCTFGAIELEGADGMLGDAVRARLSFATGDRYSTSALLATQTALYRFGRFSVVRVRPDRAGDATAIRVKISVKPSEPNELRLGGGGGIDSLTYFIRGHLAYSRVGVLTPLTTFVGDFRPEYAFERENCAWNFWTCKADPRIRLLGTLSQQDLLITNVKGEVELGLDYLTVEAYTLAGGHTRLGLSAPLGTPRLLMRIGWRYSYADFVDAFVQDGAALGIDHPNHVGAYTSALVLDLRDKPIEPTRGIYVEARAFFGTPYAGGDFTYLQLTPELRAFYPLGPVVVAARGKLGTISGDVPETERYYGGGMTSQRGFGQRRLSPVDPATGLVVGGAGLVETSLEVRYPLGSPYGLDLGGVLFLDGGDVTSSAAALDVAHQHWAVGSGLRWITPIGPIGLDFAWRINRTGPGEPDAGRHFNVIIAVGEAY